MSKCVSVAHETMPFPAKGEGADWRWPCGVETGLSALRGDAWHKRYSSFKAACRPAQVDNIGDIGVEVVKWAHCGGPACGEWTEARGWVALRGASDYDLSAALAAAENGRGRPRAEVVAAVAREWRRRWPAPPGGSKRWARDAHATAARIAA